MADRGIHYELHEISKHFGGVRALADISMAIEPGSVHALVGENGAGKSTLGKIVAGALHPDAGRLVIDGETVTLRSPREALLHGVATIAQELLLVPRLSVAENVFLGAEPHRAGWVTRRALRDRYDELAARAGFELQADVPAGSLRTAEQQQVEILRALSRDARLIVMDEPSAALSGPEIARLHEIIRSLVDAGKSVLLVSHFLGEVLELADTVTVLRDGKLIRTAPAAQETEESLIKAMLGRALGAAYPPKQFAPASAPVLLSVRGLTGHGVQDASFDIHAGEIVGIGGLVGAGRTELARALFGADARHDGTVTVDGEQLPAGRPLRSLRRGLAMIPESRKEQGLLFGRSIVENVSLSSLSQFSRAGIVSRRSELAASGEIAERIALRGPGLGAPVGALSGGNQQKVLFARMLMCRPRVLIADEPTRGVDVGAKRAIYELLDFALERGHGRPLDLLRARGAARTGTPRTRHAPRQDRRRARRTGADRAGGARRRVLRCRPRATAGERMSTGERTSAGEGADAGEESRAPVPAVPESRSAADRLRQLAQGRLRALGIVIPFIALFIVLTVSSSSFATSSNLLNVLDQQSATLIIAAAGTLVLVSGGIDLSVGAVYGLSGVVAAELALHMPAGVACVIAVLAGLFVGLVNGIVATYLRISALIATLAMSFVIAGVASLITSGNLVDVFAKPGFGDIARTNILTVRSSIWIMVVVVVLLALFLARTTIGRYMYAAGGNPEAARIAGVRVNVVKLVAFALSGGAAGVAGVIDASRVLSRPGDRRERPDVRGDRRNRRRRHEHPRRRGRRLANGRRRPVHRADRQRLRPARARPAVRADHARRPDDPRGRTRRLDPQELRRTP